MAKFFTPTKLSDNIRKTPEGYLLCLNVPIARTGWQEYGEGETPLEVGDDGKVMIFRSELEVFRPETIASFEGKSLTIKHPAEFVGPDNWQYLAKGQLHNVRKAKEADDDGEWPLLADILVTEARAIQLVENGFRELSCGYEAEYEQTGDGKGIQTNIIGNHLALVDEGRAGSSYAINDEKGKGTMATKLEKALGVLKKKFGAKVVDEAMKDAEGGEEGGETATVDKGMMDELVKTVKDLQVASQRIEGMVENKKAKDKKAKDDDAYDDDEEGKSENETESKILERVTALEAAVAKLLEKKTGDDDAESEDDMDESEDDESEESEDDDAEESEGDDESEDDAEEGEEGEQSQKKSGKTGDAARIEILAPGFKPAKGKNAKVGALKRAYATKDGKKVIDSLTGGKKPDFKSQAQVSMLFRASSEILKQKRGTGLEGTREGVKFETGDSKTGPMTAEQLNEANAKFYGEKKGS